MQTNKDITIVSNNLKERTKTGLYWSFFNKLSNQGIQFIIGLIMARLLSPSDYGVAVLPTVFIMIASIFVGGGFSAALVSKKEIDEHDLATSFYYGIIVGIICYVILFFASPWIANFYNTPVLKDLMKVTSLVFLLNPLNAPQNVILQRRLDFKTPAKVSIVVQILSGIVGVILAAVGYGVWALVLSNLFASVFRLIMNWYAVRWYPKTGWSNKSFKYLWNYGNKLMASWLLSAVFDNIAPVIIGKYYGTADLGNYSRAAGYAGLPAGQISGTIDTVSFPVISRIKDDDEKLNDVYRRMIRLSVFVCFPIMMILAALARPLVIVMLTEKWEECIVMLQILCFASMWHPIHVINLNLLKAKGRSDLYLGLEVYKKAIIIIIMLLTLPKGLIWYCFGGIITSLLCLFVNTYYTGKLIKCGFFRQMRDILPTFCIAIILFVIVYIVTLVVPNMIVQIFVGVLMGMAFYIGISILLRFKELKDVVYLMNLKRK